jgi:hypothetical protein
MSCSTLFPNIPFRASTVVTSSDPKLLNHVKTNLKKKFEMFVLRYFHYFLGLQVLQTKEELFLSQPKYACDLSHHFHMDDSNPSLGPFQFEFKLVSTCTSPKVDSTFYRRLFFILLYLTHTCPDILFVVGLFARYM